MKKLLISALIAMALPVLAQTNTPPNAVTLPEQVLGYFSSFNPLFETTFRDNRFDLWTGASSLQNGVVPLVNDIGLAYDVWRPTPATNSTAFFGVGPSVDIRNGGVAGTLVSFQGGVQGSLILHDVKVSVYLDGGRTLDQPFQKSEWYGEVGLRVRKAWGLHFYGGVGIGAQFPKNGQVFSVLTGATF